MPVGFEIIKNGAGVDTDLVGGASDPWDDPVQANKVRNSLKTLGGVRSVKTLCASRELYVVSATQVIAPGHGVAVEIDWSQINRSGTPFYTVKCRCSLYTNDAGTTVIGYLRRTTGTPANDLTFPASGSWGTVSWSTSAATPEQTVPVQTGIHLYEFHVIGNNANNGIRAIAEIVMYGV